MEQVSQSRPGFGLGLSHLQYKSLLKPYRGCAARAEDAQETPTQSHVSPSILVYADEGRRDCTLSPPEIVPRSSGVQLMTNPPSPSCPRFQGLFSGIKARKRPFERNRGPKSPFYSKSRVEIALFQDRGSMPRGLFSQSRLEQALFTKIKARNQLVFQNLGPESPFWGETSP